MALISLRLDSKKTASLSAIPGTMWIWLTRLIVGEKQVKYVGACFRDSCRFCNDLL